jgi:hypothetical protein
MSDASDFFREFGILPHGNIAPPEKVRAYLSQGAVVGQYIATAFLSGLGLAITIIFAFALDFPFKVWSLGILAAFGYFVYLATHKDYLWVELDGDVLRAKHLYTRRIIERTVEEIEDLLTLVFQVQNETTRIVDAWLGRVRGVEIRFHDKRTPLLIQRIDPAMKNAKELIEAVIYRMEQKAAVDMEIRNHNGKPLVRRIFWKVGPP